MTKRNRTWNRVAPFAAGVLIGSSVVTPVFAATLDMERVQPFVLLGSLIVLLVGLILKATAGRSSAHAEPRHEHTMNPSDLRWRESDTAADIALPAHGLR